jgi:hypothetical protein
VESSGCPTGLVESVRKNQVDGIELGSPAIDAGANPVSLPFDQRGPGFSRAVGFGPDIGSFERNGEPVDHIFRGGFVLGAAFCDW